MNYRQNFRPRHCNVIRLTFASSARRSLPAGLTPAPDVTGECTRLPGPIGVATKFIIDGLRDALEFRGLNTSCSLYLELTLSRTTRIKQWYWPTGMFQTLIIIRGHRPAVAYYCWITIPLFIKIGLLTWDAQGQKSMCIVLYRMWIIVTAHWVVSPIGAWMTELFRCTDRTTYYSNLQKNTHRNN